MALCPRMEASPNRWHCQWESPRYPPSIRDLIIDHGHEQHLISYNQHGNDRVGLGAAKIRFDRRAERHQRPSGLGYCSPPGLLALYLFTSSTGGTSGMRPLSSFLKIKSFVCCLGTITSFFSTVQDGARRRFSPSPTPSAPSPSATSALVSRDTTPPLIGHRGVTPGFLPQRDDSAFSI